MKFVLYAILAYLLFLFIFRLVIPVYIASRKIRRGFREMQSRMQEQHQQQQTAQEPRPKPNTASRPKAGDYIDFEEVK